MLTEAEYKSECQITNYTPYLARVGELWGRFCEDLVENWPRYNGTALYNCFFHYWYAFSVIQISATEVEEYDSFIDTCIFIFVIYLFPALFLSY